MMVLTTQVLPQTIITTAILLQVLYYVILAIGLIFIGENSRIRNVLILYFIVSLFFLAFSNSFLGITEPLIPNSSFAIPQSTSILLFFLTNIIFLIIIVQLSGKMLTSIFTPLLSVLPANAIFLHESLGRIILYASIIILFFIINLKPDSSQTYFGIYKSERFRKRGLIIISAMTLIVSVVVGVISK